MILKPNEAMMTESDQPQEMREYIPPTDTQILDFLADERIFDGYGDVDIDDATGDAIDAKLKANPDWDYTDEDWQLEWRRQFRIAIMRQMARIAPQSTAIPSVPATGHIVSPGEQNASTGV